MWREYVKDLLNFRDDRGAQLSSLEKHIVRGEKTKGIKKWEIC